MIAFTIPVRTVSEANSHQHWRERQRRAKAQRKHAELVSLRAKHHLGVHKPEFDPPCTVTMTRISPRELDDDNLAGALKHVRDGIADALGINDRDPRVTWATKQRRGPAKTYLVEVTIE